MSPANTFPCPACGAAVPTDQGSCPQCRLPFRHGPIANMETAPGSPIVRRTARRSRISDHGYVPPALLKEIEAKRREEAALAAAQGMGLRLAVLGAALAAVPYGIGGFLYIPDHLYALVAFAVDAIAGALVGLILTRTGGSAMKSVVLFGIAFVIGAWVKIKLGYPSPRFRLGDFENAGATALLVGTFGLTVLVAGLIGNAVDSSSLD